MGEEGAGGEHIFVFPIVTLVIGIMLDEINKKIKFLGVPDSVLQFIIAIFLSFLIHLFLPQDTVDHISEKYTWNSVAPHTLLLILLPPLLFESAFKINSHTFLAKFSLIVSCTAFAYIFTLIIAVPFMLPVLVNTGKCSIPAVFLFVSIIVATDPVAVVAILEEYGAPHRLKILIEGESLLNDGLALFTYRVALKFLLKETDPSLHVDHWKLLLELFLCLIVSPIVGTLAANAIAWFVARIDCNKKRQALIIVAVYGTFYLCDSFDGSSAIGLVFFGIVLGNNREHMPPNTSTTAIELWETLGYWASNVIFMFAGFCVGNEMFSVTNRHQHYLGIAIEDTFMMITGILITPAPFFARIASLYLFYHFFGLFRPRHLPPATDFVMLSYAGLRGALGLILALELNLQMAPTGGAQDAKKVLLLTCSTTFACLVFQGMTFSAVATKEGTTKRSKYVRETCYRLSRFLDKKMLSALRDMQLERGSYLLGANWTVVSREVRECLNKYAAMKEEQQVDESSDYSDSEDILEKKLHLEAEMDAEARTGYYGIVLARVHDAWSRGAVSGNTAHIIVTLLEHGIDEGKLTARDVDEHLNLIELSLPMKIFCLLSSCLFDCSRRLGETKLFRIAELRDRNLYKSTINNEQNETAPDRGLEKWWLFHTLCVNTYAGLLMYTFFVEMSEVKRSLVFMVSIIGWLATMLECTYILHEGATSDNKKKDAVGKAEKDKLLPDTPNADDESATTTSMPYKEVVLCTLYMILSTSAVFTALWTLWNGLCVPFDNNSTLCMWLQSWHLVLHFFFVLYRSFRSLPMFIVIASEWCTLKKLSRARVRLAVLHFLHQLANEIRISRSLFSRHVYEAVRREEKRFSKLMEGVLRLELKEDESEMDVVPVVKTRQAIRMMSYNLGTLLANLQTEGFVPEDARKRWSLITMDLIKRAEALLYVQPLKFSDWLLSVKWLPCLTKKQLKVAEDLEEYLSKSQAAIYKAGSVLETNGTSMYFIKKGICKVTEWLHCVPHRHQQYYLTAGEFIGERNLVLVGAHVKPTDKLPLLWPKRRYETTTICELVRLDERRLCDLLVKESALYRVLSSHVQIERFIIDLRSTPNEITSNEFTDEANKRWHTFEHQAKFFVEDGFVALVGCWTQLLAVRPAESVTNEMHIAGPAELICAPFDKKSPGMVYMFKRRAFDAHHSKSNSNISLIHDGNKKVVEKSVTRSMG